MKNSFFTHLFLSAAEVAEETVHETAQLQFSDVLVSFLYFAAVLALIYLVLVLVSKAGEKKRAKRPSDDNEGEENDEDISMIKENTEENSEKNTDDDLT